MILNTDFYERRSVVFSRKVVQYGMCPRLVMIAEGVIGVIVDDSIFHFHF